MEPTWEEVVATAHFRGIDPLIHTESGVLGDLELYRAAGLALDNRHAFADVAADHQVGDLEANEIAATQLAVDREVEERQVAEIAREFEARTNGPNLLRQQRALPTVL